MSNPRKIFIGYYLSTILLCNFSVAAQDSKNINDQKNQLKTVLRLFKQKKFKSSLELLKRMEKAFGKKPLITFNQGVAWANLKNDQRALYHFKDVLNSGSSLKVAAEVYMAKIYLKNGKYSTGLRYADQALSFKDLPDALYNQLIDEVEKISKQEPKFFNLAEKQFKKGNYDRSYLYFRFAWIIKPNDTSQFMQSYSLIKMKKFRKAQEEIEATKDPDLYNQAYELLEAEQEIVDRKLRVEGTKRFSAYLDHSEGSNSNPNTEGQLA